MDKVRWTAERAEMIIPLLQSSTNLNFQVIGTSRSRILTVRMNGMPLMEIQLTQEWQKVSISIPQTIGFSHVSIQFIATAPWSPSEDGSADTRILGVAVKTISVERLNA